MFPEHALAAHRDQLGMAVLVVLLTAPSWGPLRDPVECLVGSQLVALDRRVMAGILVTPETP